MEDPSGRSGGLATSLGAVERSAGVVLSGAQHCGGIDRTSRAVKISDYLRSVKLVSAAELNPAAERSH